MTNPTIAAAASSALDQRFALDVQGVGDLRRVARASPQEGARIVARQFEAILMGMVLKSMRDATPDGGLFGSESTKMYQSLLDQQLAQQLSGRGLGVADALLAQLRRSMPQAATAAAPSPTTPSAAGAAPQPLAAAASAAVAPAPPSTPSQATPATAAVAATADLAGAAIAQAVPPARAAGAPLAPLPAAAQDAAATLPAMSAIGARVQQFVAKLGGAAREAAAATGLPEKLILAQAALESAWGRREVLADDGSTTFNVFGVKADRSWRGPAVEASTTEVVEGVVQHVRARFRAYGSYQEAFADYAKFLTGNPRYAALRRQADPASAATALQAAGYATDPRYATKLLAVMKRLID